MSNWTTQDPGAGDGSAGTTAAGKVSSLETSVTTLASALDTALAGAGTDVWASDAADAFRDSLLSPRSMATDLTHTLSAARTALEAYATEISAIKSAHQSASELYSSARRTYLSWYSSQICEPDEPLPPRIPATVEEAAPLGYISVPHYTYQDLNSAATSFRGLGSRRQTADDALVSALTPGADWASVRTALANIGITSVDDLSPSALADGFAEFADGFSWSDMSAEDTATMQQFFDMWGADHTVMGIFFQRFGGENTANLIGNLGENASDGLMPSAAALTLAMAIRSGLSNGSSRWSPMTANTFADSLMSGIDPLNPTSLAGVPNVAWLFSSSDSPMGETLAVAMANRVDALERENGELFNADSTAGGAMLARYESELTGLDPIRVADLSGTVLSTLGEYPEAAFEWLTSENGDARVDYWFGERDWSKTGFEGPTGLWNGAIQTPGSLLTPPYDEATAERVAILTTDALTALVGNESFDPRALSEPAQMNLADGFTRMLPQISDILQGADGAWEDDPFRTTTLLGSTDEFPIPNLTKDTLAELFGAMAYAEVQEGNQPPVPTVSDAGLAFLAGADSYRDAVTVMIGDAPLDSAFATDRLSEIASLYGMIDGSYVGGVLEAARLDDADAQEAIDMISSAVGAIAIPPVSGLVVAGGNVVIDYAQDLTVGLLLDAGVDGVAGLWQSSLESATVVSDATEAERYSAMESQVRSSLEGLGYPAESIDERVELVMGDYEESRDAGKWRAQ